MGERREHTHDHGLLYNVQKVAEGKSSYEFSWKVQVIIKKRGITVVLLVVGFEGIQATFIC